MTKPKTLVATASWEGRFELGMRASIDAGDIRDLVCLYSLRYQDETLPKITQLKKYCSEKGVQLSEKGFDFEDQVAALRCVEELTRSIELGASREIVFDVSTTPRPILWSILDGLSKAHENIVVRYYAGQHYGDWQTNEEGEPRLVLRRSGIMYPDQPTTLILMCGPEISRAEKMCFQFEPRAVHILRDPRASQYGTVRQLPPEYRSIVHEIEFDNKDLSEQNFRILSQLVDSLLEPSEANNVVAAALGPKLGALLLYRLSSERPDVGLSYVVSGKHNPSATTGLGPCTDIELRLTNV